MSKATSKNVTILEAFKLQGEKSSAVEKYLLKDGRLRDLLRCMINRDSSITDKKLFKEVMSSPEEIKLSENSRFDYYNFCEILRALGNNITQEISFSRSEKDLEMIDIFEKLVIELAKKERAQRITDFVEVYDFSELEVLDTYKNVKIIKDIDFNTKFRKKSFRETFIHFSYNFKLDEEEIQEIEKLCKKHKSNLLLVDNNLAFLTKENLQVRGFTELGKWISTEIF